MSKSKITHELGAAPDTDFVPLPVGNGGRSGTAGDSNRRLEMVPPGRLVADKRNAHTHSQQQINQIARSIQCFGFVSPVLADDSDQIIAGHGRVEAAKQLGLNFVPVIRVTDLSGAKRKAYAIADNRLAELAGWDGDILVVELEELRELDFDLAAIGFDLADVDIVGNEAEKTGAQSAAPKIDRGARASGRTVSRAGDLWRLGGHELRCGDTGLGGSYTAVDAAIKRWQRVTGQAAMLAGSGKSFAEIAKERARTAAKTHAPRQTAGKREVA